MGLMSNNCKEVLHNLITSLLAIPDRRRPIIILVQLCSTPCQIRVLDSKSRSIPELVLFNVNEHFRARRRGPCSTG